MNNKHSYLPFALGFVNIILFVFGVALAITFILFALNINEINLFHQSSISIKGGVEGNSILVLLSFLNGFIILFVLFCVRQFFKNILNEQIFVHQNVLLANRIALSLLIVAFIGDGIFTINGYSFFNITFIITSLVVWTIGKVLEKANQIAEENEFTI